MLEIPWLDHFQFVIWPPYSSTPWSFQDWFDPQRSIVYRYNMGTSVNIFQRVRGTLFYVFSDSMSSSILCAFTSWPSRQVHLSKLAWVWVTQWLQWSRLPVRQVLNHGILERFWNYSWRRASHLTKQATTRGQFEWPSKPGCWSLVPPSHMSLDHPMLGSMSGRSLRESHWDRCPSIARCLVDGQETHIQALTKPCVWLESHIASRFQQHFESERGRNLWVSWAPHQFMIRHDKCTLCIRYFICCKIAWCRIFRRFIAQQATSTCLISLGHLFTVTSRERVYSRCCTTEAGWSRWRYASFFNDRGPCARLLGTAWGQRPPPPEDMRHVGGLWLATVPCG